MIPVKTEFPVTVFIPICRPLKAPRLSWCCGNFFEEVALVFLRKFGHWFGSCGHSSIVVEVSGLNALLSIRAAIILLGN